MARLSQVVYPQGGAYMVTTENLKQVLIAGGSLLVDYMLTVAVSVSSGANAITSAIPLLHLLYLHISILLVLIFDADEPSKGYMNQLHLVIYHFIVQYHCLDRLYGVIKS